VLVNKRSIAGSLVDASRDSLAASLVKTIDEIVLASKLTVPVKTVKKPLTRLVIELLLADFQQSLPGDVDVFDLGLTEKEGCDIRKFSNISNLNDKLFGKTLSDSGYKIGKDEEGELILIEVPGQDS